MKITFFSSGRPPMHLYFPGFLKLNASRCLASPSRVANLLLICRVSSPQICRCLPEDSRLSGGEMSWWSSGKLEACLPRSSLIFPYLPGERRLHGLISASSGVCWRPACRRPASQLASVQPGHAPLCKTIETSWLEELETCCNGTSDGSLSSSALLPPAFFCAIISHFFHDLWWFQVFFQREQHRGLVGPAGVRSPSFHSFPPLLFAFKLWPNSQTLFSHFF